MDEIVTTTDPAELRRLYGLISELDTPTRQIDALLDSIPAAADRIKKLEGALGEIAKRTTQYGDRTTYPIHSIAVAALAQPRVDSPTETPEATT